MGLAPAVLAVLSFAVPLASSFGPIGAPCFANESAIELFTNISLAGKVAVVTGADGGIGIEVARALAARRATIVMPGRNLSKVRLAAEDIRRSVPHADLVLPDAVFELASFAKVREVAEELAKRFRAIHLLVNNAGAVVNPHQALTENGLELVFQVDYPSQWLFTQLLLPQLRAGRARVINVASKAYSLACEMAVRSGCAELSHLPPPVITSSKPVPVLGISRSNYGIAKQLMVRWTEELARRERAAGTGVTVFTLHPGFVNTSLANTAMSGRFWRWFACMSDGRKGVKCPTTPPQGALTPTFLALAPGIEPESGSYFEWCGKTRLMIGEASESFQEQLWDLTAKWVANFSAPIAGGADGGSILI